MMRIFAGLRKRRALRGPEILCDQRRSRCAAWGLRYFAAAFALLMAASLAAAGCSKHSGETALFELLADERESVKAGGVYEPTVINLVHSSPENSAVGRVARMFKTLIEDRSKGQMMVEIYPNDSLGYVYDYSRALGDGTVDVWIGSGGLRLNTVLYWASTISGASLERIQELIDSKSCMDILFEECKEKGYLPLDIFPVQYRAMTSNRPIWSLVDFKGLKMRTYSGSSLEAAYWGALGAETENYDIHELYRALEDGLVDGQSNTLPLIVSNRLYEQQDYIIDLRHMTYFDGLFIGEKFYEGLTDGQRQIVDEVAAEISDYARDVYYAETSRCELVMEKAGVMAAKLDDKFREEVREITAPVVEAALRERDGDELVDFVLKALK